MQLANPAAGGGANKGSLTDYQKEALTSHPIEVRTLGLFKRDPKWRPLNREEIELAEKDEKERHWKNHAVYDYSEAYWMKGS